jgi:integrase
VAVYQLAHSFQVGAIYRSSTGDILAIVDSEIVARFEAKVDRSGEHHLWLGARTRDGSGTFKAGGTSPVMARKVAWELVHGPVPRGAQVLSCQVKACVRVEHLRLKQGKDRVPPTTSRTRAMSVRVQVQLNGQRAHRRVRGGRAEVEATKVQLREQLKKAGPRDRDATGWNLDELVDRYLVYLEQQGREARTRARYADVRKNWVSPAIGSKPARRLTAEDIDRCFALMRKAGQSASSMNQAKALLSGAFKWGQRTGKVLHNPMIGFQLPKSTYVPREKLPPEAEEVSLILTAALEHTPDIAPILTLAATTGARLGELVALRRSDLDWGRRTLWVRAAADIDGSLKSPKRAQHRREVPLDDETLAVLRRQTKQMAERAELIGVPLAADPFLFSDEPDCSAPVRPIQVTRRLQVLKGYLGVEDKRPETVEFEDEALRLRRFGVVDRSGRPGPAPIKGAAMSYDDIGKALGRSQMWARRACDAALRREQVAEADQLNVNLSFNGFRKFTSSELLDAGFNISVVAERQGHGPQVLAKHYSKARMSARRKAAEHLGQVVHGHRPAT